MRYWIVGVAAGLICATLAGSGCARRRQAQFDSEFVHCDNTGAVYARGMNYRDGTKPGGGWDGEKIVVGVAGGRVEYAFKFIGHRDGKDVYRVVRSFPLGGASDTVISVEVAYEGKQTTLFDDDTGTAFLRPVG